EPQELLRHFAQLDDHDVTAAIKYWAEADDFLLSFLSKGLLNRKLFRLEWHLDLVPPDYLALIRRRAIEHFGEKAPIEHLVYEGMESNRAYDDAKDQIKIRFKNGVVKPITECSDVPLYTQIVTKHYISYPKELMAG